jgi:hypothetical protein
MKSNELRGLDGSAIKRVDITEELHCTAFGWI